MTNDPKRTTLRIDAKRYQDEDDCLTAAANDVARERGLDGYDLDPRWEDGEREIILVDVPAWAASAEGK